jgi:hypothetical protein
MSTVDKLADVAEKLDAFLAERAAMVKLTDAIYEKVNRGTSKNLKRELRLIYLKLAGEEITEKQEKKNPQNGPGAPGSCPPRADKETPGPDPSG